ncbi:MAG TPA: nuclear transport factor 2 family protein, partial [Steroidobacteraceae bacterium]|nr:nuclear transport factor 2 family protein [Steroidobacteraceae bacterium]
MRSILALCLTGAALLSHAAHAADPVVTDSRLITEERRVQILEAKLASMQREIDLIEDRKAIERVQQLWGHYVSEGMAHEAAGLFSTSPAASIEYAQQGIYLGRARIEAFLKASGAKLQPGELRETPVMQAVIHVAPDGQTAKGRWRSLVMGGVHGQDGHWEEGPYENEFVKEGGGWKISRLH